MEELKKQRIFNIEKGIFANKVRK